MTTIKTMNLEEGAAFLGLSPEKLRKKLKQGKIPGCKPGQRWLLIYEDIVEWMRNDYKRHQMNPFIGNKEICLSAKRKAALTTIQDSRSVASECKSLREQLREQRRKNMKKSEGAIYERR